MSAAERLVLIVDDSPEDREVYRRALNQDPNYIYSFIEADCGEDGLELISQLKPDCMLLDYNLPDLDGLELLGEASSTSINDMAIIMLTGQGNESIAVEAMKRGAGDYLIKGSTDPQLLCRTVRYSIREKQASSTLMRERRQAQVTLASIADGVVTIDSDKRITYMNRVAERLTGCLSSKADGRRLSDVVHVMEESTGQPVDHLVSSCLVSGEQVDLNSATVLVDSKGSEIPVEASATPIRDNDEQAQGVVMVVRDVTRTRELSKKLSYQATHDGLTDLINRQEFERQLGRVMKQSNNGNALCYMDLDQFKVVNDTCGHVAGDELLRQLSMVLRRACRPNDILGRLGGDEFGLLMPDCTLDEARVVANNLLNTAQRFRFTWGNKTFQIGMSIGLVPVKQQTKHVIDVLSAADTACYVAKDMGRNRIHVQTPDDKELAQRHLEMQWVTRINLAMEENRFQLYSQAIMPLLTNTAQRPRYEFLVRMNDEKGNLVMPGAFLPAAERYDLISALDRWVVTNSLTWMRSNRNNLENVGGCSINLSGISVADERFLKFLLNEIDHANVPVDKICFEITETAAIRDLRHASQFIDAIKARGCNFALDDFGSGMSSFAYLKNLPVDYLKIDGMFVKDLINDTTDFAFVKSINEIGHVMGMQTIAEFVQCDATIDKLRSIGVDYAQGYGISKPVSLN